jgi:hypothetical protein
MPHDSRSVDTELLSKLIDCYAWQTCVDQFRDLRFGQPDLLLTDSANMRVGSWFEVIRLCFFDVALVRVLSG